MLARLIFSCILGALLTLAFAPFNHSWLAILIPAVLVGLLKFSTPTQSFLTGWCFGVGFFGTGVYWVYISIHTFGKAPALLALIITLLFILILALFPAVQSWLTKRFFKGEHFFWGFPCTWVCFEIIRTYFLSGFPWLFIGYSQINTALSSIAPIFGVYGVSFLALVYSSVIAYSLLRIFSNFSNRLLSKLYCAGNFVWRLKARVFTYVLIRSGSVLRAFSNFLHRSEFQQRAPQAFSKLSGSHEKGGKQTVEDQESTCSIRKNEWRMVGVMIGIAVIVWVCLKEGRSFNWGISSSGNTLKVSLIQGNIHQFLKWDQAYLPSILNTYRSLTELNWHSDLLIWPEAAVPLLQEDAQPFLEELNKKAHYHQAAIVLGIPILFETNFYNGMIVLGKGEGTYLKRRLVPFGEFVPFRSFLSFIFKHIEIPMSDLTPGRDTQGPLIIKNIPISPTICYEIAYPSLVASQLPKAEILITLTDDSWFDGSIAMYQQLQMTQMRALETGRYLLAATNDGITAIINSKGRIVKQLPAGQAGVLTHSIPAMKGQTPWVKLLNFMDSEGSHHREGSR